MTVTRVRVPVPVAIAVAGAWAMAVAAEGAGLGHGLGHHALVGTGVRGGLVFLGVWTVHVAAMMLPSSLPMFGLFTKVSAGQHRPGLVRGLFTAGYLGVWTAFGAAAFAGDTLVHAAVHRLPALEARPQLVLGAVLVGAGLFQFSGLKHRCLRECRLPSAYLRRHYRRGEAAALRLGAGHGLHCLGCCWALMLALFAMGSTSVLWMAPFAALMVLEKSAPWGHRLVAPAGAALIATGSLVALA